MSKPAKPGDLNEALPKRRMLIARAHEARDLDEEIMPWVGLSETEVAGLMLLSNEGGDEGFVIKLLFEEPVSGVSLTYAWFKANYLLPQHSHDADCTYYVISGEAHLGAAVLRAGDVFFVPADSFYTYQAGPGGVEILEFRTATKFAFRMSGLSPRYIESAEKIIGENLRGWKRQEAPLAVQRFNDTSL